MIAQSENSGQVRVLAAFASDGMSLRRHIDTTVRPWIATNASRVLTDRRLLVGAYDDTDSWELIEILETARRKMGTADKPIGKPQ